MNAPGPRIDFDARRVTVMGLGHFGGGAGAARYLLDRGARVTITDLRPAAELSASLKALEGTEPVLVLGEHRMEDFTTADLVVASPAVPWDSPYLQAAREAQVPVETEITLFLAACPCRRLIGVTGSNGKTTTTSMLGEIFTRAGRTTWVGGNLGGSLLPHLSEMSPNDTVVLELSSFQLQYTASAGRPFGVAVLLNLTPNHLDRHGSMEAYEKAKLGIFAGQGPDDTAVLNADDPRVARLAPTARTVFFSQTLDLPEGFLLYRDTLLRRHDHIDEVLCLSDELKLRGRHNRANALAAAAAAHSAGASAKEIGQGLRAFRPVPHRLEFVAEVKGVAFYNDSIATTPESALAALDSFTEPVVLIAGGYDKGVPLKALADRIARSAAAAVFLGQIGPSLEEQVAARATHPPLDRARSMDEAVDRAFALAPPGAVVLLSPATASYDMFRDFEERGEAFRRAVTRLGRHR
jgi:UDP-N-acetylmuramoylalanine--D-glutamate ligase